MQLVLGGMDVKVISSFQNLLSISTQEIDVN